MRALVATFAALLLCGCSTLGVLLGVKPFEPNRTNPNVERLAQEVLEPPPQTANELLLQGDQLRDGGDVAQAALSYLKAVRLDPTRLTPVERIGFLHLAKGDVERAEASFNRVLESAPSAATALAGLGLAKLQKGAVADARASLERAVTADPSSEIATLGMGLVCDWSDQREEARRYYARALELSPVNADAENNLGVSYYLSADYANAEQHLRRAVELDPKDPAHHNNLALALCELGRFDEALAAFRAASNEATAQNNLGYVHYRRGDYAAAIQHYERALVAQPTNPLPVIRNLRRAQEDLDRSRAAAPAPAETAAPLPESQSAPVP
jgi:Flp pilus assembly protein TadD